MKLFLALIIAITFNGCGSLTQKDPESPGVSSRKEKTPSKVSTPVRKSTKEDSVKGIWELLNRPEVTLFYRNVDDGSYLTVIVKKGIGVHAVPSGHWELTSFALGSKSYHSGKTTKKFVFRVKDKSVYAGSLVIQCPKVGGAGNSLLKPMIFFNRYQFSSESGPCEIVIGNDFAGVKSRLRESKKYNGLNISEGF